MKYLPRIERIGLFYEYYIINLICWLESRMAGRKAIWQALFKVQYFLNPFFIYRNLIKLVGKEYSKIMYIKNTN